MSLMLNMKALRFLFTALQATIGLSACGQENFENANVAEFAKLADEPNVVDLDVRTAEEYAEWCEAYDAAVPFAPLTPTWYSAFSPADNHICKIADLEHTGGVSLFVPSEEYARKGWVDKYHGYDWYHATGMENTGW